MRITRVAHVPFAVAFRRPLVTGAGTLAARRGFVVEMATDAGIVGRGEASPAYWLGEEDLAATDAVLCEESALVGRDLDEVPAIVRAWMRRSPAAACALDTARIDATARAASVSFAEQLLAEAAPGLDMDGARRTRVPVAALLVSDPVPALEREATTAVEQGYGTLKLKVGRADLAADIVRVRAVRAAAGPGVRLRLDANRAWDADQARVALAALAPHAPDFVEEPLAVSAAPAWPDLARETAGVALALDESIADESDYERFGAAADVIVLKAARLGGPTAALALGRRAHADGRRVVVTDSIETTTGAAAALHLAVALRRDEAVGLGGARLLDVGDAAHPWRDLVGPGLGGDEYGALAS